MDSIAARITYVCEVHPHHAAHHALYRVVEEIGGKRFGGTRNYGAQSAAGLWLDRRLFRFSGNSTYTACNLREELSAALSILSRPGSIVHIVFGDDGYRYLGFLNGVRGARILATFHQPPSLFDRRVGWKTYLGRLSALHVVSRSQIAYFAQFVPREKIFFIPLPVDADFFSPDPSVPKTGRRCIFAGQWLRDFSLLRETIAAVHRKDPAVQFTLVTFPERFPPFRGMPNVELKSGVSDEELRDLYRRADLLLLPIEDCTFTSSMVEGMACGLPVVANDVGGAPDYVDPTCGVLLDRGAGAGAMADAVRCLLADPARRVEMGARARERAWAIRWQAIVPEFIRLYRKIAGMEGA